MIFIKQRHPRDQRDKLHVVATVECHVLHLLAVNDSRDLARYRIHLLACRCHHRYRRGHIAHLQHEVRRRASVRYKIDTRTGGLLESGLLNRDRVVAYRKCGGNVESIGISFDGTSELSGLIGDAYRSTNHRQIRRVSNGARDAPNDRLCPGGEDQAKTT